MGSWVNVASRRIGIGAALTSAGGLVLAIALAAWPAQPPRVAVTVAPSEHCRLVNAKVEAWQQKRAAVEKLVEDLARQEQDFQRTAERYEDVALKLEQRGPRRVKGDLRRELRRDAELLRAHLERRGTNWCGNGPVAYNLDPVTELEELAEQYAACNPAR